MIRTRIIKCHSCHQRLWVPTTSKTVFCIACKTVNSMPGNENPIRVFQIRACKRRAVVCGVSYNDTKQHKLKGTIHDVKNMKDLLITHFHFSEICIRQLTDDQENEQELIPTKKNIMEALKWLVEGSRSGDSLVFYFAGHGSQKEDMNSDEVDGLDETICPSDFEKEGMIVDDDINNAIVRPLLPGVTLHAIIDSCHSATVLDLPYNFNAIEKKWEDNRPPSGAYKGTSGGLAICISACKDYQKIVDSSVLNGKATLTYNLIQEIKKDPGLTYGALITSVQRNIDEAIQAPSFKPWLIRNFCKYDFSQVQLSSSEMFDVYKKEFKL